MGDDTSDIETLSLYLPLPYRVLFLFILGVWLFALNLHYFHVVRIDISPFLRYTLSSNEPPLHRSVYSLALFLTAIFVANLLLFYHLTVRDPELIPQYERVPLFLSLCIVLVFFWPAGRHKRGRYRFLRTLRRTIIGGLDPDLRFADILLADALTSYAKVFGDGAIAVCMFLSGYSSTHPIPDRTCNVVPFIMALPYLSRLRQCLIEYRRAGAKGLPAAERNVHLYNALKYSTAFPVIFFGWLARYPPEEFSRSRGLQDAWYISVLVNSLYSFYWDVARDWDLTIFSRNPYPEPYGLRQNRHFVLKEFYYFAIVVDLLLRFTWSVKLSPHLDFIGDMEGGIFVLEILEVFRRWVWVFFRVEKEFVANGSKMQDTEEGRGSIRLTEFRD